MLPLAGLATAIVPIQIGVGAPLGNVVANGRAEVSKECEERLGILVGID